MLIDNDLENIITKLSKHESLNINDVDMIVNRLNALKISRNSVEHFCNIITIYDTALRSAVRDAFHAGAYVVLNGTNYEEFIQRKIDKYKNNARGGNL
jgi:hypothetical protein